MRALVVHPGTQHSFQLAAELHRLHVLSSLHTGFAVASGGMIERLCNSLPASWQQLVSNRRIKDLPHSLVHLQPILEWVALTRLRQSGDEQSVLHWRNERFQRSIPTQSLMDADVVIGFDTSSWVLAQRCRDLGKPLVLVQTIGHPDSKKAVREELVARFPEWLVQEKPRLPIVRDAEQQEHDGATLIVANSGFTRQTLIDNGVSSSKIRLIPPAVDCDRFSVGTVSGDRPFRFVFAGSIDARKGVPLLLQIWRQLQQRNAELWLVGPASEQAKALLPNLPGLRYLGAVPQVELPSVLRQCDVFVFPSYFEGFARVILQAMACGLPVIATTESGLGPDFLGDGDAGWIIPCGDGEKLTKAMIYCLEHSEDMPAAGRCARDIAERFNWQAYGRCWLPVLEEAARRNAGASRTNKWVAEGQEADPTPRDTLLPPKVLLAHPGTQYSGQLASQLQRRGLLSEFHTCFSYSSQSRLAQAVAMLPPQWQGTLANRRLAGVPPERLHTRPWLELVALSALRCGKDEQDVFYRRNSAFQRAIPDSSIRKSDIVVGFDTSSWILGRRARDLGRVFLLDQSIAHPRAFARIAPRLKAEFPDWTETILFKSEEEFAREAREHADASLVVVPSRFVARTLQENGVDASKIRINPFGVDLERFQPAAAPPSLNPLRFCFAGSFQPRKGFPLLLNAWRRLPANHGAELWIAGDGVIPASVRSGMPDSIRILGRLPHAELATAFRQCHVFVLPSYFEGLAQVQIEAAACGLPVIGTESSGCAEIVRQEATGFVLPTGDFDALRAALMFFISEPGRVISMRERLLAERSNWSWDAYGDRWSKILEEVA